MAGWLLGPRALKEFVRGRPPGRTSRVHDWADQLPPTEPLYVSRTTWAYVRSEALKIPNPRQQQDWIAALDDDVPAKFSHRLLDLRTDHFVRWSEVRHDTVDGRKLSEIEAFDVAVCLREELAYVTDDVAIGPATGIAVHSPW